MRFLDRYFDGRWVRWALAFTAGMAFQRFVVISGDPFDDFVALSGGIAICAGILLLRAHNEREWPFELPPMHDPLGPEFETVWDDNAEKLYEK